MTEQEQPGWRQCHFCPWTMRVTAIDLLADTGKAYSRHLTRHAETADMEAVEKAQFDALTADLEEDRP